MDVSYSYHPPYHIYIYIYQLLTIWIYYIIQQLIATIPFFPTSPFTHCWHPQNRCEENLPHLGPGVPVRGWLRQHYRCGHQLRAGRLEGMWSAKMCKNGGSSDIFHNFWMVSNTDRDFGWKIKDVVDLVEEMSPSFTLPGVLDEVLNVMDSHQDAWRSAECCIVPVTHHPEGLGCWVGPLIDWAGS